MVLKISNTSSPFLCLWSSNYDFKRISSVFQLALNKSFMATGTILPGVGNEVILTFIFGLIVVLIFIVSTYLRMGNASNESRSDSTLDHQSYNNEDCPICISPQILAVETNCGHKFCGSCLKSYMENQTSRDFAIFRGRLSCPFCRQGINLLLPCFTQDEVQNSRMNEERLSIESVVHEYNVRFGDGHRSLSSYIRDCPVLIRHMLSDFFSFRRVVWMFRIRVIICFIGVLIYLANPTDVIPEAIFGIFGFLDDLIVFFLCAIYVSVIYRRFVISRGVPQ